MILLIGLITCLWVTCPAVETAEQDEHRDFQYNSVVDAQSGRYNFAYDTGNDNEIAHSLHMQYRDVNGIVRGRYGYTDPRGKLRMVEYEAGPDGFKARGDVGPDQFPHDQAPDLGPPAPQEYSAAYRQAAGDDLELVPSPVQMAGWDPLTDPMGTNQPGDASYSGVYDPSSSAGSESLPGYPESDGQSDYSTRNITDEDDSTSYDTEVEPYDDRYPRIIFSSSERIESEVMSTNNQTLRNEGKSGNDSKVSLNVNNNNNNNETNQDELHKAASSSPGRLSSEIDQLQASGNEPYVYRKYPRQTQDPDAEVAQASEENQQQQQTHDHDKSSVEVVERPKTTHDHEAEMLRHRINHDHSGEYYHQRHDHEAERAYYYWRYRNPAYYYWRDGRPVYTRTNATHDHDTDKDYYHRRYYPNSYPGIVYYKDSHSQVPHEHNYRSAYHNGHYRSSDRYDRNQVYHNGHYHNQDRYGTNPLYHNGHYHYPDQYGRYDFNDYPATARPRQLKYIPSDKYHDKYYYWTDDK